MTMHNVYTLSNTSASLLTPAGTHSGMDITIQNINASGYVYIGSSTVSAENFGYRILPNHAISFELSGLDALYAISSAPSMKIAVLKTSLERGF